MSDRNLFDPDPEPIDQAVNDPQAVYDTMMKEAGAVFGFQVNVGDPRPDRSLSLEAMEDLRQNMISWVMTRVLRKMKKTGRGAKKIQVTVTVSLDGEEFHITDTVPYFAWPDDGHRTSKN